MGKKYVFGYTKHMREALPGASFIGFTGTPIEKADANTQEALGGYVSICDIEDAKEGQGDGADLLRKPPGEAGHQPRGDRRAEPERGGGD